MENPCNSEYVIESITEINKQTIDILRYKMQLCEPNLRRKYNHTSGNHGL